MKNKTIEAEHLSGDASMNQRYKLVALSPPVWLVATCVQTIVGAGKEREQEQGNCRNRRGKGGLEEK